MPDAPDAPDAPETSILSVSCNHCGAPLDVQDSTRFVTCSYCQSRLQIHRSGSAVYTAVLQAIESNTQQIAQNLEALKLQNQLEQIDREWATERQSFVEHDKDGRPSLPSRDGAVSGTVVTGGFGIVVIMAAVAIGRWLLAILGLALIAAALVAGAAGLGHANALHRAECRYRQRRQRITDALRQRGL